MNQKDIEIRQKLAQAYKILAHLGLDDHTYTHLSSRSSKGDSFYIYPFGFLFEEVTKDSLIEATFDGQVIAGHEFQYNKTGYVIHGSIYEKRRDINTIFHIHTPEIVAVSAMKDGLLPISQWALHFYGQISYHEYDSLALDNSAGRKIAQDLEKNYTMLLRNHGSITSGRTIQEAMFYTYHLQKACKTQQISLAMGKELILPDHATCQKSVTDLLSFEKDLGIRDWHAWTRLIDKKQPTR